MAESLDTLELVATLDDDVPVFPIDDRPKTINDLPKELLVSIFIAVENLRWVRYTVPLVCKEWAEIYRSQDASPLHETLDIGFRREVESAAAREERPRLRISSQYTSRGEDEWPRRRLAYHGSRVISWAERRAGSVRKLRFERGCSYQGFSSKDLGRLVAVVGSSLTEIRIGPYLNEQFFEQSFWKSLRTSVAPHGRLRSLVFECVDDPPPDLRFLGQLAGSLEELVLDTMCFTGPEDSAHNMGLQRFSESLCALTELRRLALVGHQITAISARISSLKKLKELNLSLCRLSSLPKELGELSGLTKIDLSRNKNLGRAPQDEAFPAELRKMTSLRELSLSLCGLRAVPAFVGELKSLEILRLTGNRSLGNAREDRAFPAELRKMEFLRDLNLRGCDLRAVPAFVGELKSLECLDLSRNFGQLNATLDFLMKGCPCLREVKLTEFFPHYDPESEAHFEAFKAKLLAENPDAKVICKW